MNRYFFALAICFLFSLASSVCAQISEQEILLSGNYLYGQAYGETREEAINNSRVALIEKLVVTVTNEAELNVRDDVNAFESEFVSRTQTMSRMQLRGLDVMPKERRDGSWEALAYISNEDYRRSMNAEKDRLVRLLRTAEQARNNGNEAEALQDYTQLLIQRPFYPLPLYADDALENAPGSDIAEFAARQIERQLSAVNIELRELQTYTDPVEVVLELELTYGRGAQKRPLEGAEIRFDLSGYGFIPVTNGYAELSLDVLPERAVASYPLALRPAYNSADEGQAAVAESVLPAVNRRLEIDFTPHIRLDFSATQVGTGGYQFQPAIQNLAVKQVAWNFGDGLSSSRLNPRQAFTPAQMQESRIITLTLNGREELSVSKELRPDGSLHSVESFDDRKDNLEEDPLPVPRPVVEPEPDEEEFSLPDAHKRIIDELVRSQRWDQAQRLLTGFQQENRRLKFGARDAVGNQYTDSSYVLIIDPESRRVEAVLSPEHGGARKNLRNGQLVESLSERYAGRAPVWVWIP